MNAALAVCCLVILKIAFLIEGAPVETQTSIESTTHTPNCNNEDGQIYDQRQNGTENYRIHVNGLVFLVAPADAVLQAAQLPSLPMEPELSGIGSGSTASGSQPLLKPKPRPPSPSDKVPSEELQHPLSSSSSSYSSSDQTSGKDKNLNILNFLNMFRSLKHVSAGEARRV